MRASFQTLFRKGRYFKSIDWDALEEGKTTAKSSIRELERFSAAALAFAWKHDPKFRRHFWKQICLFRGDPPLSDKAQIRVEPFRWADLLIRNPTKKGLYLYVVEMKVYAQLTVIQNPSHRKFGQVRGYGYSYARALSEPGANLRYVVFGCPEGLNLDHHPWKQPIRVQQRYWEDLADSLPSTALCTDLASSFSRMGIPDFPRSDVHGMKVNCNLKEIAKVNSILREVTRRVEDQLLEAESEEPAFSFDADRWFLGVEMVKGEYDHPDSLENLIKPLEKYVTWFGYFGHENSPPRLGVWFYCGNGKLRGTLAEKLQRKFKRCEIERLRVEDKSYNLLLSTKSHRYDSDCDWFCSVYRALGLELRK